MKGFVRASLTHSSWLLAPPRRAACRSSAALLIALLPGVAIAQSTGNGFLFGTPAGAVTFHAGWSAARANSDVFSFTTNELTLDRGDFSSPNVGIDLAFRVFRQTQLVFSSEFSGMNKRSEFRDFIDNNDQPIEQTTRFRRIPLTLSVKQYLSSPGRSIGRFAWIPSRAAAYVGAGGGVQYYRFDQVGDFIDPETFVVYGDEFKSRGWAPLAHAFAGFDYTLSPRFAVTTEGRYVWSSTDLSTDFSGFHPIDLSGFATTVGLTVRF
jgi:hypothetical protein